MFEATAATEGWARNEWARVLAPLLTLFAEWEYKPRLPAHAQAAELPWVAHHWLLAGNLKADQVAERVVIDWLLRDLPWAHRQAVGIRNPSTALELVEAIELADAAFQWEAGERAPPFPQRVVQERPVPGDTQRPISWPAIPSHHDEPMPTEAPAPNPQTWLAGCAVHLSGPCSIPERDTTRTRSTRKDLCCAWNLAVGRWHSARSSGFRYCWEETGPGLTAAPPAGQRGNRRRPGTNRRTHQRPVLLASDSGRDGRRRPACSPPSPALRREEQPALCRTAKGGGEVTTGGSMKQDGGYPGISSLSPTGRTFGGRQHRPADSRPVPLAWRGRRGKTVLSIPLPIIEVPFKRIGMDLVGPLPKSARGHKHILVIVDYATRYPEAIPLRKATSKAIAQELFLLASQVSIPAEILTDQGTPFMSRLMADLFRLLRVKQLRTTVYHPQTDGLVERFNQTLKQMLRRVVVEDKRD
ncbi:hypothetical protein QQF64_012079 [Cirrhinus molitorella]|uniref:Integrase catalytic domain-containing protein n=1 Tax=Cirrhinus molitorella TaxID=172907 RepID=A0ABR3LUI4_9TELE